MLEAVSNQDTESKAAQEQRPRPALDKRFLVNLKGKEFVQYSGLLDLAHQNGLSELKVELLQYPSSDNGMECIVQATAVTDSGMMFCDVGDANPGNTNKAVAQHIIRMASTRAKARVLRDLTNIGMTALEELGEDAGEMINGAGNGADDSSPKKARKTSPAKGKKPASKSGNGKAKASITDAQKRAIWSIGQRKGYDENSLRQLAEKTFGCDVPGLSTEDAAAFIVQLQKPAPVE